MGNRVESRFPVGVTPTRLLAGLLTVWCAVVLAESQPRPNVVVLLSDDQRADTIGAWGNRHIQTPNLDRLAARGVSFRNNYCFGGNSGAVCIPSRAMLMSGRTWFRVGHELENVETFPTRLRKAGYRTFATGKWHNGKPSFLRSFERGRSIHFGGMDDHTRVQIQHLGPDGTFSKPRPAERFSSEQFADEAIGFLRGQRPGTPFLAYVAFTAPHDPRNPPESWATRYRSNPPPLPRNYLPQHPFDNGQLVLRDENLLAWPRPPELLREQIAEYYGLISHMDQQIGRILDVLDQSPVGTNTVIVFASDQGLALGSHGLLGKQNVYEHSMRSPLMIAGPGIPAGRSVEAFTYLLDLHPTLCDLTGVTPPEGLDGESLRPLWTGSRARIRDTVFLPYLNLMRAVRDDRWKLICYPPTNHRQLFDLQNDPDERVDLGGDPDRAADIQRLLGHLKTWQDRVGDTLPWTTNRPAPLMRDLTGLKREPDGWQPRWIVEKYFGAP